MGKRLWDLAKSRIEIGTILPGHRHKVFLVHTATFASLVVPARARVWARHAPCARERPNHYIRHTFMIGNNASKVHLQGESVYKKRALVLAVKDSLI